MGHRKGRLTVGRLMAVIGIVALGIAMARVDAAPAVSLCVFAGCTWYLAGRRYEEGLARRAAEGAAIGGRARARLAVRSVVGAALTIGLPDAAFLAGLYGYMAVIRRVGGLDPNWRPELDPTHILIGALVGIAAVLSVAEMMRRGLRPAARRRPARTADRKGLRRFADDGRFAARRVPAC